MSIVKINAITVPADSGDELARRFAARAGAVDDQDGFEGFELLQPNDGRTTWLVVSRWRDEETFQAWVNSPAFSHGHRSMGGQADSGHGEGGGHGDGDGGGHGDGGAHGHGSGHGSGAPQAPVGVSSEVWSFAVAGGSAADRA